MKRRPAIRRWDYCLYKGHGWLVTEVYVDGTARIEAVGIVLAPIRRVRVDKLEWTGEPPEFSCGWALFDDT